MPHAHNYKPMLSTKQAWADFVQKAIQYIMQI